MGDGSFPDIAVWSSNPADCVWAQYGDDFVVFHRPSGKTHLLNLAGYRLLTEILPSPATTAAIAARLANTSSDAPDPLDERAVNEMLVRFEYLGLVDRSVRRS
jgi:PqqD family protein of HPr-rel-A system